MLFNDLKLLLQQFHLKFTVTATKEENQTTSEEEDITDYEEDDDEEEEEKDTDLPKCKRPRLAPSTSVDFVLDLSSSTPATSDNQTRTEKR